MRYVLAKLPKSSGCCALGRTLSEQFEMGTIEAFDGTEGRTNIAKCFGMAQLPANQSPVLLENKLQLHQRAP